MTQANKVSAENEFGLHVWNFWQIVFLQEMGKMLTAQREILLFLFVVTAKPNVYNL